jgi:hypothetical protein
LNEIKVEIQDEEDIEQIETPNIKPEEENIVYEEAKPEEEKKEVAEEETKDIIPE